MNFKKISEVKSFTIRKIAKTYFERWNDTEKKYEKSEVWAEGFSPKWLIETPEYFLPLSKDQISQCLMSSFKLDGTSNIVGKSYTVKTNGKVGKEIRYFLNEMRMPSSQPLLAPEERQELAKMSEVLEDKEEVVDTTQIPF